MDPRRFGGGKKEVSACKDLIFEDPIFCLGSILGSIKATANFASYCYLIEQSGWEMCYMPALSRVTMRQACYFS